MITVSIFFLFGCFLYVGFDPEQQFEGSAKFVLTGPTDGIRLSAINESVAIRVHVMTLGERVFVYVRSMLDNRPDQHAYNFPVEVTMEFDAQTLIFRSISDPQNSRKGTMYVTTTEFTDFVKADHQARDQEIIVHFKSTEMAINVGLEPTISGTSVGVYSSSGYDTSEDGNDSLDEQYDVKGTGELPAIPVTSNVVVV